MSYDITAWRLRPDSPLTESLVYSLIGEDVEIDELQDLDSAAIEEALDQEFPDWRSDDAPFSCELTQKYLSFQFGHSRVREHLPRLIAFAWAHNLTLFDPQVEEVLDVDIKRARAIRKKELRELVKTEVANLRKLAEAGDPKAQLELGNRLTLGEGVRKNLKKAFTWYLQSAEAGNAGAMFNAAASLQYGDGVDQNLAEALRWYLKAAETDKTYATFALGEIYLGFGPIARDNAKAESYFQEALANGHPDAKAALRLISKPEITLEAKKKVWTFWNPRC